MRFRILYVILIIIFAVFINHLKFGNSNSTLSQYEMIKNYAHVSAKKKYSNALADYIYGRIEFYQKYDDYYERTLYFWRMYEYLQRSK